MVVELDKQDKKNFSKFIKAVIECRGNDCAEMIFNLSNYEGHKVKRNDKFENYHEELKNCFSRLNNSTYSQLEGMVLLWDMMRIIRENKMKLDG
jgi:predicted unusual protein kinase regulating ubiquinone biosynthesis (AarF/ABC1/UbiB family)